MSDNHEFDRRYYAARLTDFLSDLAGDEPSNIDRLIQQALRAGSAADDQQLIEALSTLDSMAFNLYREAKERLDSAAR